ncbi:MAG: hypothetical protein AB1896_04700 [Thermodesulfobacteriota bacterium]
MNISIDGQIVAETLVGGENLEEMLRELQERHLPPDRMVGEVRLNGRSYNEDLPHAAIEVGRGSIESLELITRSPEEIALHFVRHGTDLMDGLVRSIPRITEIFRLGDEEEANEHFLRFLDSLHLLLGMIQRTAAVLGVDPKTSLDQAGSLEARLESLAELLGRILDTQEQSDWVFLADILEYEVAAEIEALRDFLPHLTRAAH